MPSTSAYTLNFNATATATGPQVSQINTVTVNWGDYVNGSADTQTYPPPTTYPGTLATHTYPNGPGNYTITSTANLAHGSVSAGGLSVDPSFGGNNNGTATTNIGGSNDLGYGIAIDTSGSPSSNTNYGKLYVAGIAGTQFAVTRYNPDGTLDTSFNSNGLNGAPAGTAYAGLTGTAYAVTVDSSGKIVAAGNSGNSQFAVARFNSDGTLDTSFNNVGYVTTSFTGNAQANAVVVQSNGSIVVAGTANLNGNHLAAVVRYTSAGQLDTTFGSGGIVTTQIGGMPADGDALVLETVSGNTDYVLGGTSYCTGGGHTAGAPSDFSVARLTPAGALDTTFGTGGCFHLNIGTYASPNCNPISGCGGCGFPSSDVVYSLAAQTDGKIIAAGTTNYAGGYEMLVGRLTTSGRLDSTYGSGGLSATGVGEAAFGMALQQDGKVVLAGSTGFDFALARYTTTGALDPTFGSGGTLTTDLSTSSQSTTDAARAVAVESSGRIVAAGYSGVNGGNNLIALVGYQQTNQLNVTDVSPPLITSPEPNLSINAGATSFSYTITAQDPNKPINPATGQPDPNYGLTYNLLQPTSLPGWLQWDSSTGTLSIPSAPVSQTATTLPITLDVMNSEGVDARQGFTLIVQPQAGPVIAPIPDQAIYAGTYGSTGQTYQLNVSGYGTDAITYSLQGAPNDPGSYDWITLDGTNAGQLDFNPTQNTPRAQPYHEQVTVTDTVTHASTEQTFLARVYNAHVPLVTLTAPNTSIATSGTINFHVAAFDPGATAQTLASVVLQQSSDGGSTWTSLPNPPPAITPDSSSNAAWDIPWAAPSTVPSPDPQFRAIVTDATGGTTMGSGESDKPAAIFPSSEPGRQVVQQGLVVHVYASSSTAAQMPMLHVPDEQTIEIDNIPVPITRAYDTADAQMVKDFGYGWYLDLGGALHSSTGNNFSLSGEHVEVIAPNGQPEGFTFRPRFIGRDTSLDKDTYMPDFVPDPGVTDALSAVSLNDQEIYKPDGSNHYLTTIGQTAYQPNYFYLTTAAAITYQYNVSGSNGYLASATDSYGDSVTFSSTAIGGTAAGNQTGQPDSNITFVRDGQNRISGITVTRNTTTTTVFTYNYNPTTGDLSSVTDYASNVTNYSYNPDGSHPHLLTGITRGSNTILSVGYSSGVVTSATNGNGAAVPVIYDASIGTEIHSRAFTLSDATLLVNLFTCVNGLPWRETDGEGAVIDRTFDGSGHLLTQTAPYKSGDALRITRFTYDGNPEQSTLSDNLITSTDPQGNRTWSAWSFNDKLEVSIAPMGAETTNLLGESPDPSGDLDIQNSLDPQGNATGYTYTNSGWAGQSYQLTNISTPSGQDGVIYNGTAAGASSVSLNDQSTGGSTTENFDSSGNLTDDSQSQGDTSSDSSSAGTLEYSISNGLRTNFQPDPNGNPVPSSSPDGSSVFIYDSVRGVLDTVKVPSSYVSSDYSVTDYDLAGRVIDTVDAQGHKTTLTLDRNGRTIGTTLQSGASSSNIYDSAGRLSSSTDVHNVTTQYTYDADDRLIQTQYADGSTQQTVYDALGRAVAASDRHLTSNPATGSLMSYDSAGNLVQTQFVNNIVITIVSDGNGIYHSVLSQAGTPTATQETVYDQAGRPTITTDRHAPGQPAYGTRYVYDAFGNTAETDRVSGVVIQITSLGNASDSVLSSGASVGVISSVYTSYAIGGHLLSSTGADGQTTQYQYDSNGRQSDVFDPLGYDTKTGYDTSTGRVNLMQGPLYNPANGNQYQTTITYTQATGVQTTTYNHNGSTFTTSTTSDGSGHTVSSTDALGRTTISQYNDPSGKLTQVTQPQVGQTNPQYTYKYDIFATLTDQIDALGRDTKFTTVYNADGSYTTTRTLPDGTSTETTAYDSFGRISRHTDFKGQYTKYTYDSLTGRLSETDDYTTVNAPSPTETIQYQYDPVTGIPTIVTDTNNGVVTVTTNTYDPNTQNLLSVTTTQGSSSSVIHYAYNSAGRHTETWTGSGSSDTTSTTDTFYAYDELGRLRTVKVTRLNGAALATPQVTTSFYDPDGNLSRTLLPNGTRTVYGYDDLDHMVWTSNIGTGVFGDVLLSSYDYNVDLSGRRNGATEQRLESDGTYSTSLYTWGYDQLDRLTSEQLAEYDPQGTNFTPQNYTANYVLDVVGNRLSKTTTYPGYATEAITYAYDHSDGATSDDRLMTETATLGGNSEYSTSYGYDANGSMTSLTRTGTSPQTDTYTYDLQNRLLTSTINNVATNYGYDASGNRISTKIGSNAVFYLIDNNNPTGYSQTLQESATLGGTPTTTYTLGSRVLAQANASGTELYLVPDGRGGTRLVTDANGTIKARYDYDAFGSALNFNAATALTKYLYDGQQYDSGAGQYDLRARYYSAAIGRFTSSDNYIAGPGDLHNSNLYVYAADNSINAADPSGHDLAETLAVAGILTTLTTFLGLATTASVGSHIAQGQSVIPDGLVVNIGAAYAYRGGTAGGIISLLRDFKTGQWLYFGTGEAGLAPISVFKNYQGFGWMITAGFIWNMKSPSQLSGLGTTATWPLVLARFTVPTTLAPSRWAQIPLALARYNAGNYKDRQGVIQFSQSSSGPAEIAGGLWSYSFGWTAGYSSTPRPVSGLVGDVAGIAGRLMSQLGVITGSTSPDAAESILESATSEDQS